MNQKEKRTYPTYASARPTEELFGLLARAQALDVSGLGYSEIYERASRFLVENKSLFFDTDLLNDKADYPFIGAIPSSFKIRLPDPELDKEVVAIIAAKYHIKRVMTPFKLKTVLKFYVRNLDGKLQEIAPYEAEGLNALKLEIIDSVLQVNNKETAEKILNIIKEETRK